MPSGKVLMTHSRPVRFYASEFFRLAAILALVLMVMETFVPLTDSFGTPARRIAFVATWAGLMAAWNAWRGRKQVGQVT